MRSKQVKLIPIFEKELLDILEEKLENGTLRNIPRNKIGIPIITDKINKAEKWREVKNQLINADFNIRNE